MPHDACIAALAIPGLGVYSQLLHAILYIHKHLMVEECKPTAVSPKLVSRAWPRYASSSSVHSMSEMLDPFCNYTHSLLIFKHGKL